VKECLSCAARADEAEFPRYWTRERLCCDCLAERTQPTTFSRNEIVQRRAQYRAAFRYRSRLQQRDLVDLVVPPP
jgi:hypothetical protein